MASVDNTARDRGLRQQVPRPLKAVLGWGVWAQNLPFMRAQFRPSRAFKYKRTISGELLWGADRSNSPLLSRLNASKGLGPPAQGIARVVRQIPEADSNRGYGVLSTRWG